MEIYFHASYVPSRYSIITATSSPYTDWLRAGQRDSIPDQSRNSSRRHQGHAISEVQPPTYLVPGILSQRVK